MIHRCNKCKIERNCGCGDCGVGEYEICTNCNNTIILSKAQKLGIPKTELGMDPIGGYMFKPNQLSKEDHSRIQTEINTIS